MMDGKSIMMSGESAMAMMRPKIEIVRVPSIERTGFRPLDGVQLRAAYSHVRVGTYCPEIAAERCSPRRLPLTAQDVKPPNEQSRKYKKNLGPVSRLLRRRHHATSLATKSCDNIYSVNKANSFSEWKHGHNAHHDHHQDRQSNSLDWRVGRRIDKNSSNLDYRKGSRSAEQLSRSNTLQTSSTKSKIVSLLKRLSPRLPRPNSKNSLPSSPSICPWVQVEYSNTDATDGSRGHEQQQQSTQETDYSFQRELQLNEMRKRAIKASNSKQELANDATTISKENTSPRSYEQSSVHIQDKQQQQQQQQQSNPKLRDVHEDRASSEERREVAGPGEPGPLPRTSRRSRPHSLAVQPLNYQRLDPDQPLQQTQQQQHQQQTNKLPNMTSQESIGSCSLDVDRSASDRSADLNVGSLSEKTLHSLNLSCNGDEDCEVKQPTKPRIEITAEGEQQHQPSPLSNGHQSRKLVATAASPDEDANGSGDEQLTSNKKPSYLGLACSINGYSGITRYDSKLREGFRSRDSSPGTRLLARDASPAAFSSNETINSSGHGLPPKSQSISPLAMDRHQHSNGFANGHSRRDRIDSYLEANGSGAGSGRALGSAYAQGYSEVDRGLSSSTQPSLSLSPVHGSSPNNRLSPVGSRIAAYNQHNKSFNSSSLSISSPKSSRFSVSHTSYTESSTLNGSSENGALNSSASSEKSFIQQRVERLYGPGALAQGFFFKRTTYSKLDASDASDESSNNNNTSIIDNTNVEQSLKNLPVLRHLRPEFRAQLPVVSPRRPTDGTEQIIKPLKRISVSPAKNDAKETKSSPAKTECNATNDLKMTASVTSLTDQQPAAPKVVLPVLEPSASSTSIPKQGVELPTEVEEKDGHYFMNLLNKERDRLIFLAEQAEAELAGSGASALPEEAAGKFRSAAGKARLLATQKMKQFEGLCQKNIIQVPGEEFPTTNEDLAGFWDMVMLQVVQVHDLFELLERSRNSHWQEILPEQKSAPTSSQNGSAAKKRQVPASKAKSAASSESARKAREAREQTRRQLLEEKRRAMRSNAKKLDNSVEIFIPDT